MRKTLGLVLCLSVLSGFAMAAQDVTVIKVKVQVANVRSEPDIGAEIVKQVKLGTLLEAAGKVGRWFEVAIIDAKGESVTAFVHESVVDVVSGAPRPAPVPETRSQTALEPMPPPPPRANVLPSAPASGFKFVGGMIGANVSYTEAAGAEDLDPYRKTKLGFVAGVGYEMGGRLGFEVDLLYIQKGTRLSRVYTVAEDGYEGSMKVDTNLDEFSLPLLIRFRPVDNFGFTLTGGGEAALVVSSKAKWTSAVEGGETESGTEDLMEETNKLDYGLVFGAGYELAGPLRLSFEARYHLGLANLAKAAEADLEGTEGESLKTNGFIFVLGIKF